MMPPVADSNAGNIRGHLLETPMAFSSLRLPQGAMQLEPRALRKERKHAFWPQSISKNF
jgi:hypothetical protein